MKRLSCCGPRCDMLLSGIFSFVALLGAAISLLISVAGLFSGPYCLYQEADGATHKWGYPKLKIFNNSSVVMVQDTSPWSGACTEPPNIETWHSSFFILLSISNILQIILCLSQIVNGIIGALCGHCDPKKWFSDDFLSQICDITPRSALIWACYITQSCKITAGDYLVGFCGPALDSNEEKEDLPCKVIIDRTRVHWAVSRHERFLYCKHILPLQEDIRSLYLCICIYLPPHIFLSRTFMAYPENML